MYLHARPGMSLLVVQSLANVSFPNSSAQVVPIRGKLRGQLSGSDVHFTRVSGPKHRTSAEQEKDHICD